MLLLLSLHPERQNAQTGFHRVNVPIRPSPNTMTIF